MFIWRLYEFFDNKKGRFRILYDKSNEAKVYINNSIGEFEAFHSFEIINISTHRRIIRRPSILLDNSKEKNKYLHVLKLDEAEGFPKEVLPGDAIQYKFPAETVDPEMKKREAKKFRLIVYDTTGKKYKSKWIKI